MNLNIEVSTSKSEPFFFEDIKNATPVTPIINSSFNESQTNPKEENLIDLTEDEYQNIDMKDIPMYEKEKGQTLYAKGEHQLSAKAFSKSILSLRHLVSNNYLTEEELSSTYLKKIIIPCN